MKTRRSSRRRGIALILVLAFLVLIAVFVVGFFSAAQSELSSSGGYAAGITTAQLADTTTNIVMGQIRAATTRPEGQITYTQNTTSNANPTPFISARNAFDSWASQPGMIRTFQGGPTPSTTTTGLYKLYSSNYMVVQGDAAVSFLSNTDVLNGTTGWQSQPALWTDLNEPVHVTVPADDPYTPATSPWRYPVLYPKLFAYSLGYDSNTGLNSLIGTVPGASITATLDPSGQTDTSNRPARMPVRWLYILKDGAITAPTGSSNGGTTATWANTPGTSYPSETNPIIGRIAFWTDDDCCKVNINTAGGFWPDTATKGGGVTLNPQSTPLKDNTTLPNYPGSYWDTPRMCSTFDEGYVNGNNGQVYNDSLALSQPRAHEYQRYPGHPSTTSLALVFNGLFSSEQIYSMAPRLVGGGSMGGTVQSKVGSVGAVDQPLLYKFDRLYSSVDELLYAEDPTLPGSTLKDLRTNPQWVRGANPPANFATSLNPPLLDEMRFFLTAHSRAPELNIFGRPRVTIWPVWPIFEKKPHNHVVYTNDPPQGGVGTGSTAVTKSYNSIAAYGAPNFQQLMNQVDTLIAFCSTVGPFPTNTSTVASLAKAQPFIFQRANPYSAQEDCGGGNNPIMRNQFLLGTYLRELMETPVPGFGQTNAFSDTTKYGQNKDYLQILAEIFDYIRCVNLKDSVHDTPIDTMSTPPQNTAATRLTYKYAPRGIVVPSVVPFLNNSPGFGRFPTISEAALVFYHSGYVLGYPLYKSGKPEIDNSGAFKIDPTSVVYVQDQDLAHNPTGVGAPPEYMVIGNMMAMFMILETFNPMEGYAAMSTFDHNGEVTPQGFFISHVISAHTSTTGGGDFCVSTTSDPTLCTLYFPNGQSRNWYWNASGDFWNGRYTGGTEGFLHTMCFGNAASYTTPVPFPGTPPRAPASYEAYDYWYPFQSTPQAFGKPGWDYLPGTNQPKNLSSSFVWGGQPDPGIPGPALPQKTSTGVSIPNYPTGVITHPHDNQFNFTGATLTLDVYWNQLVPGPVKINTYQLKFPAGGPWPVPTDNIWNGGPAIYTTTSYTDPGAFWQGKAYAGKNAPAVPRPGISAWYAAPSVKGPDLRQPSAAGKAAGGLVSTMVHNSQYSLAGRISWVRGQANNPWSNKPTIGTDAWGQGNPQRSNGYYYANRWRQIVQPGDTIRSLVPADATLGRPDGDARVTALAGAATGGPGTPPTITTFFTPHPYYASRFRHAQDLRQSTGNCYFDYTNGRSLYLDPNSTPNPSSSDNAFSILAPKIPTGFQQQLWCTPLGTMVSLPTGVNYATNSQPTIPPLYNLSPNYVIRWDQRLPDYDTGLAQFPDGGYCGKADEGDMSWKWWNTLTLAYEYDYPYFQGRQSSLETPFDSYFSPCRQVPSAVCFGSLLAGRNKHWETLAFCPNSNGIPSPGNKTPQDHILLDFFTMPVVEPYPISEPFSTAGKININYAIIPFTHIKRTTALRAALQSVRVPAIPAQAVSLYKLQNTQTTNPTTGAVTYTPGLTGNLRYPVDADQTLAAIDDFFAGNITGRQDIFHSGSQICERYLYPNTTGMIVSGLKTPVQPMYARGETQIQSFWSTSGALTGDNLREKPYGDLYARITAKSNTYTIYMRVQSLRKRPIPVGAAGTTAAASATGFLAWDETKDQVLSEYRGSTTIERYLDPLDRRFDNTNTETIKKGDFIDPNYQSLEPAYKFRVVEVKRFSAY